MNNAIMDIERDYRILKSEHFNGLSHDKQSWFISLDKTFEFLFYNFKKYFESVKVFNAEQQQSIEDEIFKEVGNSKFYFELELNEANVGKFVKKLETINDSKFKIKENIMDELEKFEVLELDESLSESNSKAEVINLIKSVEENCIDLLTAAKEENSTLNTNLNEKSLENEKLKEEILAKNKIIEELMTKAGNSEQLEDKLKNNEDLKTFMTKKYQEQEEHFKNLIADQISSLKSELKKQTTKVASHDDITKRRKIFEEIKMDINEEGESSEDKNDFYLKLFSLIEKIDDLSLDEKVKDLSGTLDIAEKIQQTLSSKVLEDSNKVCENSQEFEILNQKFIGAVSMLGGRVSTMASEIGNKTKIIRTQD